MTATRTTLDRAGTVLALLLASLAGFVDAVGYFALLGTFVAHLSGDSIATAMHAGRRDWLAALHRGFPIPWFVLGALLGSTAAEALARRRVRSIFAAPLAAELILLSLFLILGQPLFHDGALRPESAWVFYALTALPCLAMGLQSALLWRVGGTQVRTTFITGVLVSFTEELVKYLFWLRDESRPPRFTFLFRISPKHPALWRILLLLGLWVAYVLGALMGTLAEAEWALLSLAVPIIGLALALAIDLVHPVMPPG